MLDTLRQYASGWVAQLMIALLVIAFAFWGVSDIFSGATTNWIVKVGDAEIPPAEFQRRYDIAARALGRQFDQTLTKQQLVQMGVPVQILGQLVFEATLDDAAGRMGLGVSREAVGEKIRSDPALLPPSGKYDATYARQVIRAQNMTDETFTVARRAEYTRQQLVDALAGGLVAPDAYLRAIHEYRTEERTISYVVFEAPPVADVGQPGETELTDYFEANKIAWRAPEVRAIRYFVLSPDAIADPAEVSDDDARARYDQRPARFIEPEKRRVEQIVFAERTEAEAAAAALNAGGAFDALVAERSLKPADVDLGLVTRDDIVDPAVAEAAFALAEGAVSPIVDGRFGPVIVHVTAIEPEVVTPFAEVHDDLKHEIALERATDGIFDLHGAIEDARAGGDTLADAAAHYDLALTEVPAVDANGNDLDGNAVNLPTGVLPAAFESDVGIENDPVEPDRSSFAWYEVTNVTPPRDRSLAEVRDQVITAWQDAERNKRLDAAADAFVKRLQGGDDLATAVAAASLPVKTATVTRGTRPTDADGLSADAVAAAFTGPEGTTAVAAGGAPMTRVVMQVDGVETPPYFSGAPDATGAQAQLSTQIANDLVGLYASEMRREAGGARQNNVALQQMLGVSLN